MGVEIFGVNGGSNIISWNYFLDYLVFRFGCDIRFIQGFY